MYIQIKYIIIIFENLILIVNIKKIIFILKTKSVYSNKTAVVRHSFKYKEKLKWRDEKIYHAIQTSRKLLLLT